MTRPDPFSILPCMLLAPSVVRDIADALDGRWRPDDEPNQIRRDNLLAAARLRLYGERDRTGWYVVSYREARSSGLARGGADWSVGFLPDVSKFDDSPADADVNGLAAVHLQSGMEAEDGLALAYALLYEPVQVLVTVTPEKLRHNREFDLPERLRIMSPGEAFAEFRIDVGEKATFIPPAGTPLAASAHWWVP